MNFDNKTILIVGLVIGGILCIYIKNTELASVIFGGLLGYLSKDITQSTNPVDPVDPTQLTSCIEHSDQLTQVSSPLDEPTSIGDDENIEDIA